MGAIAVHEFVSLDGVFEDPSWTFEFGFDPDMGEDIGRITRASDAILLGRRTFEMFAPAWSPRTADDDPGAPFFNDSPKGVVSSTLDDQTAERTWRNSRSLGAYDAARIRAFADEFSGGVYISGSGSLVRACWPTDSSTRSICSSIRWSVGRAHACSPREAHPLSCGCVTTTPTTTASSTSTTRPPDTARVRPPHRGRRTGSQLRPLIVRNRR